MSHQTGEETEVCQTVRDKESKNFPVERKMGLLEGIAIPAI